MDPDFPGAAPPPPAPPAPPPPAGSAPPSLPHRRRRIHSASGLPPPPPAPPGGGFGAPPPPPPFPPPPAYGYAVGPVDRFGRPLADWWQRLVAILIDGIILGVPKGIVTAIFVRSAGFRRYLPVPLGRRPRRGRDHLRRHRHRLLRHPQRKREGSDGRPDGPRHRRPRRGHRGRIGPARAGLRITCSTRRSWWGGYRSSGDSPASTPSSPPCPRCGTAGDRGFTTRWPTPTSSRSAESPTPIRANRYADERCRHRRPIVALAACRRRAGRPDWSAACASSLHRGVAPPSTFGADSPWLGAFTPVALPPRSTPSARWTA